MPDAIAAVKTARRRRQREDRSYLEFSANVSEVPSRSTELTAKIDRESGTYSVNGAAAKTLLLLLVGAILAANPFLKPAVDLLAKAFAILGGAGH